MRVKKSFSVLLVVCLLIGIAIPAHAAETTDGETSSAEQESEIVVVVSTLEELEAAIESAADGDTIQIGAKIVISRNSIIGAESKTITISPDEGFSDTELFYVFPYDNQDITFQNLIFDGRGTEKVAALKTNILSQRSDHGEIKVINSTVQNFCAYGSVFYIKGVNATFEKCNFWNNESEMVAGIEITNKSSAILTGCRFENNVSHTGGGSIKCKGDTSIYDCAILNNQAGADGKTAMAGGGIYIEDGANCKIDTCVITGNIADTGGGVAVFGNVEIQDSLIYGNTSLAGADDLRTSKDTKLSVTYTDCMEAIYTEGDPIGFYKDNVNGRFDKDTNAVFLGETLSYEGFEDNLFGAKFIFAADLPLVDNEDSDTETGNESSDNVNPTPEDNEENSDDSDVGDEGETDTDNPNDEQNPSDTPETPSEGNTDDEGDSATDNEETPTTPSEPSEQPDTGEDENTPTDEEEPSITPVPPQDDDIDDEDREPTVIYRPIYIYRPTKPTTPEEDIPALICGEATIDVSRDVILEGYGDGLLHLDDSLTRSQMATIIYRLLDVASIEGYDNADSAFDDVAPNAWYCRYVSTIARAGVVCGIGNGCYNPDAPLTWGHIIAVLSRFVEAQEYDLQYIQYEGWALQSIETAVALGWIEDDSALNPDAIISRGEFVKFVNGVLARYR